MNIGQLMRGLLGDVKAVDGRTLELKVGQIVRGVLVRMLDGQDALVQINGTQVQAKLETPLAPGQSTLLQVQPQSSGAAIVLRPVDAASGAIGGAGMKEWIKALGLTDQQWAAELVRDLRRDGTVTLEAAARAFRQAAAVMPPGGDEETWMQASAIAFKRGLPLTSATIGAIRQAVYGAPAHQLLEALEQGLAAWSGEPAGNAAGGAAPPTGAAQAAAAKLRALLAEGAALMRAAMGEAQPSPGAGAGGAAAAGGAPAAAGAAGAERPAGAREAAPASGAAGEAAAPAAAHSAAGAAPPGTGAARAAAPPAAQSAGREAAPGAAGEAAAPSGPAAAGAAASAARTIGADAGGWISRLMNWLGVDHERLLAVSSAEETAHTTAPPAELAQHFANAARPTSAAASTQVADGQVHRDKATDPAVFEHLSRLQQGGTQEPSMTRPNPGAEPVETAGRPASDSLKSALMSLVSTDDTPAALKETAQQLIQHITGQQLLLSPEKTGSPFTHVTMFIPIQGTDGGQTASVHIQTRRGRKGELDAANCRLLFDLRMKTLGDTIVDVQVVDRIVSLNLWNDHPVIADLLESSRGEIAATLQQAGFQLLTLKATKLPERMTQQTVASGDKQTPGPAEWTSKPYKGVDFRV